MQDAVYKHQTTVSGCMPGITTICVCELAVVNSRGLSFWRVWYAVNKEKQPYNKRITAKCIKTRKRTKKTFEIFFSCCCMLWPHQYNSTSYFISRKTFLCRLWHFNSNIIINTLSSTLTTSSSSSSSSSQQQQVTRSKRSL